MKKRQAEKAKQSSTSTQDEFTQDGSQGEFTLAWSVVYEVLEMELYQKGGEKVG